MRALLALLVLGCCRLVVGQEASAAAAAWYIQIWNYGAPGPAAWGAQYPLCTQKPTSMQSPIDISHAVFEDSLVTPQFVTLNGGCFTWTQVNSLDDISIDLTRPGAQCSNLFMNYEGSSWTLTELRFKSPSEHTIAGGHYDAEAQLLHSNKNNKHVAIVSVLLNVHDTPSNRNNSFLDTIWKSGVNAAPPSLTVVTPGVLTDDFSPYTDLLPGSHNHFQYIGSLTEPPCSEDVDWFIFKDVVIISSDDLRMIRSVGRAKPNYLSASGSNNRPLQSGYASVQPQLVVKYTDGSTQYDPAAAAAAAAATAAQSVSFVSLASTSNIAIAALVLALLALLLALVGLRSPASTVHKPGPRAERVDIEAPPRQQQQRRKAQQGAKAAGQHQPPQKPPTQQPRHQSQLQPQAQAHKKKVLVLKKRSGDAEVLNPIMHASLARDKEDDDDDDAGLL